MTLHELGIMASTLLIAGAIGRVNQVCAALFGVGASDGEISWHQKLHPCELFEHDSSTSFYYFSQPLTSAAPVRTTLSCRT